MFIALEGIDACGKSTHAKRLAKKFDAMLFKFPDDNTTIGAVIRAHLNKKWTCSCTYATREDTHKVNAVVFQGLQLANRMEHAQRIRTEIAHHGHVIADRYSASGIVYGGADGLDTLYLETIQRYLPQPDINILLDIDVEDSVKRKPKQRDRYEEDEKFLNNIVKRYRQLWRFSQMSASPPSTLDLEVIPHSLLWKNEKNKRKWVVIDSRQPIEEVSKDIDSAIDHWCVGK